MTIVLGELEIPSRNHLTGCSRPKFPTPPPPKLSPKIITVSVEAPTNLQKIRF